MLAIAAFAVFLQLVPAQVLEPRVKVHVSGAVHKPGLYALPAGARIADAIQAAGGPQRTAALGDLELADPLSDGESVRVPSVGTQVRTALAGTSRRLRSGVRAEVRATQARLQAEVRGQARRVDLNRATQADLERLPGVGPGLARRILDYRRQAGRFGSVEELREVGGFGQKRLDRLAPYLEAR